MKGHCDDHLLILYITSDIYYDYVYLDADKSDNSDNPALTATLIVL